MEGGEQDQRKYSCPVCEEEFKAGNQLQFHYDAVHAVIDPDVVTTLSQQCQTCGTVFSRKDQLYKHKGWRLNWAKEPVAEPCWAQAEAVALAGRVERSGWLLEESPHYHLQQVGG